MLVARVEHENAMNVTLSLIRSVLKAPLPWRTKVRFPLSRLAGKSRPHGATVRLSVGNGAVHLLGREVADWRVFNEVFVYQDYRTDYRGRFVLDIGAHKGMFTAYAVSMGAIGALCFEPESRNFDLLRRTASELTVRGATVVVRREAVWRERGSVTLRVSTESWSHSVVDTVEDQSLVAGPVVPCLSLAQAASQAFVMAGGRRVIAKMDVEGAEAVILSQCSSADLDGIDEMFVETHGTKVNQRAVVDQCIALGFELSHSGGRGGNNMVHRLIRH